MLTYYRAPLYGLSYAALLCLTLFANSLYAGQHKQTYTIGVVPQYEIRQLIDIWNPVIEYLNDNSDSKFVLSPSPDIPTFEKQLSKGLFDFVYVNPFQYLRASRQQGYQAILRDGSRKLQGIIVVNRNGKINKLEDLKEKAMVFPAPNALGASLMVRHELEQIKGIKITPRYVKTHRSVYLQIATGRFPAGGGVESTLNRQSPEMRKRLKIIHYTDELFPHPVVVHPRVNPADIKKFITMIMQLSDSMQGKKLLNQIPINKVTTADHSEYLELDSLNLKRYAQ